MGVSAEDSRRANRTGIRVKMINRPERVWRFLERSNYRPDAHLVTSQSDEGTEI